MAKVSNITQQEWLEKQLGGWVTNTKRSVVAHEILRDWPSSPQGLAAKALVEAADHYILGTIRLYELQVALDAARKAGLS